MIIKCKMCGGDLSFEEGASVCECEYCGSKQTIPNADNEKKTNLFNRANRLRMNSEFDKACAIYEQIVAEFPEEAEAYWGLCLCNYGIEYVDDPATGEKKPTCHRTLPTSIMEDSNFEQACDYADTIARRVYRDEAKAIDRIQKDILSIVANEQPYDVFICYKETAEDGGRTEDSVLAQDIYDALTAKGLKVFFSRITLEDKLGVQYEPYIYAALSSAKVMLAVGTQFEYYDAVWVKNEWSRFLGMMKADKTKTLIPCFKGLDAYDMPKEFKGLQAQDMGKLGWLQDLVRGVEKLCGKGTGAASQTVQQTVVREVVQSNSNAANLMKRVYLFLEDGDFQQADEYIGKVLDADAEYAPAYAAKVLVQYKLKNEAALSRLRKSIDDNADWKKALRFANAGQKQAYEAYAKTINQNQAADEEAARQAKLKAQQEAAEKAKAAKYSSAIASLNNPNCFGALLAFKELGDYKDSKANLAKCIDGYRKYLMAEAAKKGNADPKVTAAQGKVTQLERDLNQAQSSKAEAEKSKGEAAKRLQAIPEEMKQLSTDLSQVRGLFSGGKKRELEAKIERLKQEQAGMERKRSEGETAITKANADIKQYEAGLTSAKAALAQAEEENKKSRLTQWTDEAIIAAAAAAAARDAKYAVGRFVTFGRYPQTSAGTDTTAVEWLVLARNGQKALLTSRYALDCQRYNTTSTDVTW